MLLSDIGELIKMTIGKAINKNVASKCSNIMLTKILTFPGLAWNSPRVLIVVIPDKPLKRPLESSNIPVTG